ncbi:MAG: KH domain-containing protein [Clostridia bacterium]|nr:KH domain-containing protein [Clostridia bacterium]
MQELIEFIVKSIVNDKDAVSVEVVKEDRFTLYNVIVASADLGGVIGKNGKIAEAIRTVVKSANGRERMRIKFEGK